MESSFDNKTALITGGSRGIGRAIALKLAAAGCSNIYINYLQNHIEAEKTKKSVSETGSFCETFQTNLMDLDQIDLMMDEIRESKKRIDVFVHCAALTTFRNIMELKPRHFNMTMEINTSSLLYLVQQVSGLMDCGAIIAISSAGSSRVLPYYGAMGPAKAAMESLIRYIAVELAPKRIRANCISAGLIETESIKNFPNYESLAKYAVDRTPAGRIGVPEDIANIALFLSSPESGWITGQTIIADGGYSLI